MKWLLERFEAMAMAVAYAEAGEWKTAVQIMDQKQKQSDRMIKKSTKRTDRRPGMRV